MATQDESRRKNQQPRQPTTNELLLDILVELRQINTQIGNVTQFGLDVRARR